jgi:hypothetical protein
MDTLESRAPDTFRGAPDEFNCPEVIGPDVISPVVGRIGGKWPEFWRAIGVTPPDWGPEDLFVGSPCLLSGPELVFALAELPVPGTADEIEPE